MIYLTNFTTKFDLPNVIIYFQNASFFEKKLFPAKIFDCQIENLFSDQKLVLFFKKLFIVYLTNPVGAIHESPNKIIFVIH